MQNKGTGYAQVERFFKIEINRVPHSPAFVKINWFTSYAGGVRVPDTTYSIQESP